MTMRGWWTIVIVFLMAAPMDAQADPMTDGSMLLHVSADNPRYFAKANGDPVYMVGAYEWSALVDFDVLSDSTANTNFLTGRGLNLVRWFAGGESPEGDTATFVPQPLIYERSTTCCANDGQFKFDLTRFSLGNLANPNPNANEFFERARGRIMALRYAGIYVVVGLWQSWFWENNVREPGVNFWYRHPFNSANNINSVNADANADGHGYELGLQANAMWSYQTAMLRQWMEITKDLDNVIWDVCNECYDGSSNNAWQADVIDYLHNYEASQGGYQHPVLMTSLQNFNSTPLLASSAEGISIGGSGEDSSPTLMTGTKVNIEDTDHTVPCTSSALWPWKAFTRGHGGLLTLTCNGRNNPSAGESTSITRQEQTRTYARKMNLKTVVPNDTAGQCSTQYCLIGPDDVLGYLPTGGSITITQFAQGTWNIEWLDPSNGQVSIGSSISSSGLGQSFTLTNPFGAESVVYAKRSGILPPPPPPIIQPPGTPPSQSALVTITWTPNTEADLDHYILRAEAGTSCTLSSPGIASVYPPATSWTGEIVIPTSAVYAFCMTAIDHAGQESGISNTVTQTLTVTARPSQPTGVSVQVIP